MWPFLCGCFRNFFPLEAEIFYRIIVIEEKDRQSHMGILQRDHEAYQDFIDSVEGIVWEMDVQTGKMTYLSKQAGRLLGYPRKIGREPWISGTITCTVDDRERVLDEFARAVTQRADFVTEYRMIAADRKLVWLRDSIAVREVEGSLKLRGVAIDITGKKEAEQKTAAVSQELERRVEERTAELKWTIAELESFSYTLSHDMRAPLRSIQGYAELIAEANAGGKNINVADYLQRIMLGARRLDALIQDVLKFSGIAKIPVELKRIDLDALCARHRGGISCFP